MTHQTINKSDKTNEYRDLQAKRRALVKTREALTALKKHDGEIRAMIELEQQILLLEQQVQGLSVSPGDFDTDNEFVTVNLRLAESKVAKRATKILISHTIDALAWTVLYYTLFWIGLAAFFGCGVPALVRETHRGDRCQNGPGSVAPIDRQAQ